MWYTLIPAGKTLTRKIKINKSYKKRLNKSGREMWPDARDLALSDYFPGSPVLPMALFLCNDLHV